LSYSIVVVIASLPVGRQGGTTEAISLLTGPIKHKRNACTYLLILRKEINSFYCPTDLASLSSAGWNSFSLIKLNWSTKIKLMISNSFKEALLKNVFSELRNAPVIVPL